MTPGTRAYFVVAVLALAGCATPPAPRPDARHGAAVSAPGEVARWLSCADELGFVSSELTVSGDGAVSVRLTPPSLGQLSAGLVPGTARCDAPGAPSDRAPAATPRPAPCAPAAPDADARQVAALSWHTPAASAPWGLSLSAGEAGLALVAFTPGSFNDAQRLLVVAGRCGPLTPGAALRAAYADGAAEDGATRGAARLVIADCGAGPRCPDGWRERLLALAAVHPAVPAPQFASACAAQAPPDPAAGGSAARTLTRWVIDEVGPPPGATTVAWAKRLEEFALGGGEALVRAAFEAHVSAGTDADAARLVDEAVAALAAVSERLRFEGALAWARSGASDTARARLTTLAAQGRTAYAAFARAELARLDPP